MKIIIILAGILLFAGSSCVKLQEQDNLSADQQQENDTTNQQQIDNVVEESVVEADVVVESNLSKLELADLDEIFSEKSSEAGFKTYYPSFIPGTIHLIKDSILISDIPDLGKVLTFNLGGSPDSDLPWISVQQQVDNVNSEHVLGPGEKAITNLNGYTLSNGNGAGEFYHAVFSTDDGTSIKLTSKHFNIVDLVKVARSMK
jgi:hypothetical protein